MISEHPTMLRTLITFLPDSMRVLVIMAVGLCLIVGVISLGKAMRCLGYLLLVLIAGPFYGVILKMLPGWLIAVLIVMLVWRTFRLIAEALLGRAGASHMIGILAADVVRGMFKWSLILATLPFRMLLNARREAR